MRKVPWCSVRIYMYTVVHAVELIEMLENLGFLLQLFDCQFARFLQEIERTMGHLLPEFGLNMATHSDKFPR